VIHTTKKETEEVIGEYMKAGLTVPDIAKVMGLNKRYVDMVVKYLRYKRREAEIFTEQWKAATFLLKRRQEQARIKEQERLEASKLVYCRVTSGSGYWWLNGFDFSRSDHRGQT
jgi:hypothetical protein